MSFLPPNRFAGLHSHDGFSVFDGLGYPSEHIDFVISEQQGMDALAITNHGNGNSLSHARSHVVKLQKSGRKFRVLNGVEFYFVPSLKQWKIEYEAHKSSIKDAKSSEEKEKLLLEETDIDAVKVLDDEDSGGAIIEDENESKRSHLQTDAWKRRFHLVIIAKNQKGLSNLFNLVKHSYKDGFYRYPRIDFDLLKQYGEGLHVSTACLAGIYSNRILSGKDLGLSSAQIHQDLSNLTDRFVDSVGKNNFFLELQFNNLEIQHTVNQFLIEHSKQTGIPLISTADSHYPSPDKWQARELYKKLGWLKSKESEMVLPKFEDLKCELYPKNASQMWNEFLKAHEKYDFYHGNEELVKSSIERTHDLVWNEFEDVWIDTKAKLPKYDISVKTEFQQLTDLVKEGMVREGFENNPEYLDRVKEELGDIKFLGHASYFLTMEKIFKKAEKKTLFGAGRGSGAGSLVNYLLGITQFDPIPYKLLWHRFLSRHKAGWPDIDSDCSNRDELIFAARELFGEDAVIPVTNMNTLKLKSLVKDISKFYGISYEEVNEVLRPLEDQVMEQARDDDTEKSVFVLRHEDCLKYSPEYKSFMDRYPDVEKHISVLFFQNRSCGRHAGGVIVADPEELSASMPVIGVRGELQTPWTEGMNFRHLEENGFLKFDFLGLSLLRDVENCIAKILKNQGMTNPTFTDIKKFFDENLNCRYHKQDDQKVWDHVYRDGYFTGVFQFTSDAARKFCMQARPENIEELAAVTAIFRPGPLKANVHVQYIEAKKDSKKIKYEHPIIEKILKPTYGFLVFQEQIMLLCQELCGFTPGEADQARKTLVKKSLDSVGKKVDEKVILREKFINGAVKLSGMKEKAATDLFEKVQFFSLYGFNKSHSVSYAIDSYYSAWLHTHYEEDWLATVLQSETGNPAGLAKTISEIKQFGFAFSKVDINYSEDQWSYSRKAQAFVPPMSSVKGIGKAAMNELIELRPFKNLDDMLYDSDGNWRLGKANKTCLTALCKIEALDSLEDFSNGTVNNYKQVLSALTSDRNYDYLRKNRFGKTPTQMKKATKNNEELVSMLETELKRFSDIEDWERNEKIKMSYELTTTADTNLLFPIELVSKLREKNIEKLHDITPGEEGIGWFCVSDVQTAKTKTGKSFLKIKAVDDSSRTVNLRVWGELKKPIELFTIWMAQASHDPQWGFSTNVSKMRKVI